METLSLSEDISRRADAVGRRLRDVPYFGRLIDGEVSADEYAGWLAQMHRWIKEAIRALEGHTAAQAARAYRDRAQAPFYEGARRHKEEEVGHDELLLEDLAALWDCSKTEALGRIEREPAAPGVADGTRFVDQMLARHPTAFAGMGVALETLALHVFEPMYRNLLAKRTIRNIERAVNFLEMHLPDHEDDHVASGRLRLDGLKDPLDRSAAFYFASAALAMVEGMNHYLNERFPARVPVERDLVAAR
jgi:hypothetical protein